VRIQEQGGVGDHIGLPQLQAAFANIYATMDAIDRFQRPGALGPPWPATIGDLETEGSASPAVSYLDRVKQHDERLAQRLARS